MVYGMGHVQKNQTAPPHIIGFGHLARVGKDTAADIMVSKAGYHRIGFADALKAMALDVDPELRQRVETWGWERIKTGDPAVREFLQRLGVAARDHLGANIWVDAAMMQMEPGGRYVISDVRFPNEAERILAEGGVVYRIDRPGIGPANGHISELALAEWDGWSGVVVNDGDLDDLEKRVLDLVLLQPVEAAPAPPS